MDKWVMVFDKLKFELELFFVCASCLYPLDGYIWLVMELGG